jgi:hypothetical protein
VAILRKEAAIWLNPGGDLANGGVVKVAMCSDLKIALFLEIYAKVAIAPWFWGQVPRIKVPICDIFSLLLQFVSRCSARLPHVCVCQTPARDRLRLVDCCSS